jgi:hypothetical protein
VPLCCGDRAASWRRPWRHSDTGSHGRRCGRPASRWHRRAAPRRVAAGRRRGAGGALHRRGLRRQHRRVRRRLTPGLAPDPSFGGPASRRGCGFEWPISGRSPRRLTRVVLRVSASATGAGAHPRPRAGASSLEGLEPLFTAGSSTVRLRLTRAGRRVLRRGGHADRGHGASARPPRTAGNGSCARGAAALNGAAWWGAAPRRQHISGHSHSDRSTDRTVIPL